MLKVKGSLLKLLRRKMEDQERHTQNILNITNHYKVLALYLRKIAILVGC
jgi:hypothetical protein